MTRNYSVIDSDGHILEPADLWVNYIDPKFRDVAPRFVTKEDGSESFEVDPKFIVSFEGIADVQFGVLGNVGMRDGEQPKSESYHDGKAGGFDPHQRIPDMDAEGIDATFLYPSLGLSVNGIKDRTVATAACRAYNRYMMDYCSPYPDRLFGIAMLPMHSVEDTVEEIKFARKNGFRGGFIQPRPYRGIPLHHPDNDPVWQIAQDMDFAIGVHTGNAHDGQPVWIEDKFTEGYSAKHCIDHTVPMIAALTSFVMNRICDRFPKLRVGFLEASGGWVAGWMDRMDRHFDDQGLNDTGLTLRPSEIFRRQCFISFEPVERSLPLLVDFVGRTNVLWGTDYPHADGFVDAPGLIRKLGLTPDQLVDVLATGAKRFYGLT